MPPKKKASKQRVKSYELVPYGRFVRLFKDLPTMKDYFEENYPEDDLGIENEWKGGAQLGSNDDRTDVLLYLPENELDTIAHEVTHMCTFMLDLARIPFNADDDEVLAYPIGYWTKIIYDEYEDW
jgi:hypothetical protein